MAYTKEFLQKLQQDITDAIAEVEQKFETEIAPKGDWGTCNFDTPHIFLPGMRSTTAAKVGLCPFYGGGFAFTNLRLYGQAQWRTSMAAEAMEQAMRSRGYDKCYVHYVMD